MPTPEEDSLQVNERLGVAGSDCVGMQGETNVEERAGCVLGEYVGVMGETDIEEAESSEEECEEEQQTGDRLVRATEVEG